MAEIPGHQPISFTCQAAQIDTIPPNTTHLTLIEGHLTAETLSRCRNVVCLTLRHMHWEGAFDQFIEGLQLHELILDECCDVSFAGQASTIRVLRICGDEEYPNTVSFRTGPWDDLQRRFTSPFLAGLQSLEIRNESGNLEDIAGINPRLQTLILDNCPEIVGLELLELRPPMHRLQLTRCPKLILGAMELMRLCHQAEVDERQATFLPMLPGNLLLHLLSWLDDRALTALPVVCRDWRALANTTPEIHQRIFHYLHPSHAAEGAEHNLRTIAQTHHAQLQQLSCDLTAQPGEPLACMGWPSDPFRWQGQQCIAHFNTRGQLTVRTDEEILWQSDPIDDLIGRHKPFLVGVFDEGLYILLRRSDLYPEQLHLYHLPEPGPLVIDKCSGTPLDMLQLNERPVALIKTDAGLCMLDLITATVDPIYERFPNPPPGHLPSFQLCWDPARQPILWAETYGEYPFVCSLNTRQLTAITDLPPNHHYGLRPILGRGGRADFGIGMCLAEDETLQFYSYHFEHGATQLIGPAFPEGRWRYATIADTRRPYLLLFRQNTMVVFDAASGEKLHEMAIKLNDRHRQLLHIGGRAFMAFSNRNYIKFLDLATGMSFTKYAPSTDGHRCRFADNTLSVLATPHEGQVQLYTFAQPDYALSCTSTFKQILRYHRYRQLSPCTAINQHFGSPPQEASRRLRASVLSSGLFHWLGYSCFYGYHAPTRNIEFCTLLPHIKDIWSIPLGEAEASTIRVGCLNDQIYASYTCPATQDLSIFRFPQQEPLFTLAGQGTPGEFFDLDGKIFLAGHSRDPDWPVFLVDLHNGQVRNISADGREIGPLLGLRVHNYDDTAPQIELQRINARPLTFSAVGNSRRELWELAAEDPDCLWSSLPLGATRISPHTSTRAFGSPQRFTLLRAEPPGWYVHDRFHTRCGQISCPAVEHATLLEIDNKGYVATIEGNKIKIYDAKLGKYLRQCTWLCDAITAIVVGREGFFLARRGQEIRYISPQTGNIEHRFTLPHWRRGSVVRPLSVNGHPYLVYYDDEGAAQVYDLAPFPDREARVHFRAAGGGCIIA